LEKLHLWQLDKLKAWSFSAILLTFLAVVLLCRKLSSCNFFCVCLLLKKLINKKYFLVKEKLSLVFRKIFF